MQIIDGYCGTPNIYADDIGEYNISMYGEGDYVLPVGERLGYELVSNNEVKIKDGLFITQGRRGLIKKGSTESCAIENGTQDEKRNDLIIIEYAKDGITQEESHTLKVLKGTPGAEAADPEITTGDIPGGDILHQMPLYRVKLDGLNVTAVEQLFEMGSIAPETVDPMVATEPGFAADAKATGDALKSQNSKITSIEQSFQDGCNTIVSGCTSYGSTPASNSPADIVASIGTIYTNRYNTGYNAGRTQGRNDVKANPGAYGITVAPKSLSGSPGRLFYNGAEYDWVVTFSAAFTTTPSVNVAARGANWPAEVSYELRSVTKAGFTCYVRNRAGQNQTIYLDWNAVV